MGWEHAMPQEQKRELEVVRLKQIEGMGWERTMQPMLEPELERICIQ